MQHEQIDMFSVIEEEDKKEELMLEAVRMHDIIKGIDPVINVVAVFCDGVKSFVVEEGGRFNLYIFNDYEKMDSFRYDNFSFGSMPNNFIEV